MARSVISEALTAAIDAPQLISEGAAGVDMFFVRVMHESNRYRVRAIDDETTIEIEPCDQSGYGLGEDCIRLTNPSIATLRAIFGMLV